MRKVGDLSGLPFEFDAYLWDVMRDYTFCFFNPGGEKARVALASFVLIPSNLLLLDEPSNHLDAATIEVLTAALRDFKGSIVVISHDR